jgi:hypothetical protein
MTNSLRGKIELREPISPRNLATRYLEACALLEEVLRDNFGNNVHNEHDDHEIDQDANEVAVAQRIFDSLCRRDP